MYYLKQYDEICKKYYDFREEVKTKLSKIAEVKAFLLLL